MRYKCPNCGTPMVDGEMDDHYECPSCGTPVNKAFKIFLEGVPHENEPIPPALSADSIIADYGIGSAINAVH